MATCVKTPCPFLSQGQRHQYTLTLLESRKKASSLQSDLKAAQQASKSADDKVIELQKKLKSEAVAVQKAQSESEVLAARLKAAEKALEQERKHLALEHAKALVGAKEEANARAIDLSKAVAEANTERALRLDSEAKLSSTRFVCLTLINFPPPVSLLKASANMFRGTYEAHEYKLMLVHSFLIRSKVTALQAALEAFKQVARAPESKDQGHLDAAVIVQQMQLKKAAIKEQLQATEHAIEEEMKGHHVPHNLQALVTSSEEYQVAFSSALAASEARIAALLNDELKSPERLPSRLGSPR